MSPKAEGCFVPDLNRPQPLQDAANDVTTAQGLWMGASTAIVSAGLISATTSNLIFALLGLIPGALALVATMLGAHIVVVNGTPLVTPVSDPRDGLGRLLLPAAPTAPLPPVGPPPPFAPPPFAP
jgi:hypothetical protein